jgi:hypothetical protein
MVRQMSALEEKNRGFNLNKVYFPSDVYEYQKFF